MSNRAYAIKILEEKGSVIISCNGNSMLPIIASKEAIHLKKVLPSQLRVGDAVFCKINGNLQVHKVSAIDEKNQRYEISNNKGWVNGKIGPQSIFGLAVKIENRVLVSDEDLIKRLEEFKYNHHDDTSLEEADDIDLMRMHVVLVEAAMRDLSLREGVVRQLESIGMKDINQARLSRHGIVSGIVEAERIPEIRALANVQSVSADELRGASTSDDSFKF